MAKAKQRIEAVGNLADDLKSLAINTPETPEQSHKNVKAFLSEDVKKKPTNMPWYPPSQNIRKELKQLALDEDTTIQALFTEAVESLFAKRGKRFNVFTD
jgi:hypothetical protein